VIELVDVTKRYGNVVALDSLSLAVPPGEVFGFLGPNGAGKTTAMRAVFGIVEPDAGAICWDGRPITRRHRQRFGYMPEERGLYPRMRVAEQLVYLARLHGIGAVEALRRATALLEMLGLGERVDDELDQLSLGNQQRVQLAAALVHDPEVLVLDEPFSGLDPISVDVVAGVLEERAAAGATVLFSSHQLDLVQHFCRSVAIVARGRLVATGTVDELTAGDGRRYEVESAGPLPALAGVTVTEGAHGRWQLDLDDGVDPTEMLHRLTATTAVSYFARARRPLSAVFRSAVAQ
jgi:ABC-2 type transport system ATP-binding protein